MGSETATWYLGLTTTRIIAPYPGSDKVRGEFAVERQLRDMGIEAHAPKRIDFLRRGKNRYAEPVTSPYLRGYIFAKIPADMFIKAIGCRGINQTLMAIPPQEVRRHVLPFIDRASAEEAEAQRIIDRNDRVAVSEFKAGEAIEILSGPFYDRACKFVRMVHSAHSDYPMIEADMDLFGREVKVQIDPLDVRSAKRA